VTSFGSYGLEPGQFDEPVGIDVDEGGNIYVADTWNRRVQVFTPDVDGLTYIPSNEWEISGWESQSLENKPFLTLGHDQTVFLTDTETFRVLEFTNL
jgi:DNA-binding beta-propeller fold protein YncE